jgi:hypothetical protein
MARILLIISLTSLYFNQSIASPCCGQSSSSLGVMTQRQRMNLSVSQSQSSAFGRVYDSSDDFYVWQDSKERIMDSTQLSISYKLNERLQSFFNTAYQVATYKDFGFKQSDQNLTDTTLGFTYEILPEYTFSYYRPTVYLSVFSNLPTGNSIFKGNSGAENISVSGHGQWGVGVGVTVNKIILPWSVLIQVKSLRLVDKDFGNAQVRGFFDSSAQLTMGYALKFLDLNLTAGILSLELSERRVRYQDEFDIPASRSTALSFGIAKPILENMVVAFNYSDQSLIGSPRNSLLSQTVSLNFAYNLQ